jgi:hypothetical protein
MQYTKSCILSPDFRQKKELAFGNGARAADSAGD